ncbi:MAG: hypothetical protein CMO55_10655 [Verrucomicrobiales bacterium]|nr:hypothetical protein [Verrucomicrobiales bacterium]
MKLFHGVFLSALLASSIAVGEENKTTNVPPDPFGDLEHSPKAPDYTMEVDRSRGTFSIDAEDGNYTPGSHFANWLWTLNTERWGNYSVGLVYESKRPKLGVQVKVGNDVLKGYAPRTNALKQEDPMILGTAYIEEKGEHPLMLLTGGLSNDDSFRVHGVRFSPAPESEPHGQSIDGSIELAAKSATTYAENMRYEPKEEKNCLGFWTAQEDWAEWVFEISDPGEFELSVFYGCGTGNEGSEVSVLINDQTKEFKVEDTGGFQEWKEVKLGTVELSVAGENKVALVPKTKAAKAVMDIQKVTLTPVQ